MHHTTSENSRNADADVMSEIAREIGVGSLPSFWFQMPVVLHGVGWPGGPVPLPPPQIQN